MCHSLTRFFAFGGTLLFASSILANIPGGGTGTGPNVTITDNGSTMTLANGVVSIVVTKSSAEIHTINYTFNNTGSSQTLNLLSGGSSGGKLYWFQNGGTFQTGPFTASVVTNTGDYAEISLFAASATNGTVDIHYSMLRGSPGFYTTAIVAHRSSDGNMHIELRPNIYAGSIFNWMSVDAARNRLMEVSGGSAIGVNGAPVECSLWTSGIYAGQYEDKYKYSANLAGLSTWGWSSVGAGGKNIGIWNMAASAEYYPGGPMLRQLMEHIGTTILNVFTGNYYGLATDGGLSSGETWSHVYGPYLYYCNAVTNTLTGTNAPAQALYADALAQGAAEQSAWPYSWFNNTNYVPASGRGTVTGQIVINDSGNPNASASNLWVGVVQQPSTAFDSVYDFQQWMKPYQFWTHTDSNGNFSIPNVIAGTGYTLYAFGPGAAGTFMSQNQTGGNPPILYNVPASPFSVTVTAGATIHLGTKTWTPTRVGPTVFEIGYPNRTADKFRHGEDYWVGDIGPSPSAPSPIWSKWLEFPFDFESGVNYVVGQSRWSTDWNFCQPVVRNSAGAYNNSSSTITFNLASNPAGGATASLYLGLSSDYYAAIIVTVNGSNLGSVGGVTGSPNNSIPSTGYYVGYGASNTTIREGNNGAFTDERISFPASLLHAGNNTITIGIRQIGGSSFADHAMYDYIRLELTGYVPPAPASVTAFAGNNCNLLTWPVVPGATSYTVLRSTTSGSGYVPMTNGVVGPVCGSGLNNAMWVDTTVGNGTNYYYVVRSVNPTGSSANSAQSSGATPSASLSSTAPAAPIGLAVGSVGHHSVSLNWSPSPGANFYTVYRSTLFDNGGGASNVLNTIALANNVTNTTYTDNSPTDGSIYRYVVTATSAGGTSSDSAPAAAVPKPSTPATAPGSLLADFTYTSTTNITLNWDPVPGAVGYTISRATSLGGPYTYLQTVTMTTYTDYNLNASVIYYYRVAAMNAGGVSDNNTDSVNSRQGYPMSLTATAMGSSISLNWSAASGATSYTVKRGASAGGENVVVVSGYTGTSYTNSGLAGATTYYYVVTATGSGGVSGNSPEASATTLPTGPQALTWKGDGNGNAWDIGVSANWLNGSLATSVFNDGDTVTFNDSGSNNTAIILAGAVQPAALSVNATKDYIFAGPGSIAGTNSLTKSGSGKLSLVTPNTYTGATTISGGTVELLNWSGGLAHRWSFNGGMADSVGAQTASIVEVGANNATLNSSNVILTGGSQSSSDYVSLGGNLLPNDTTPATIEIWATQNGTQNWSRIFDFGSATAENLFMSWTTGSTLTSDRVEWKDSATSTADNSNAPYTLGVEFHIVMVIEPGAGAGGTTRVTWYSAPSTSDALGAARGTFDTSNTLAAFNDANCWLGRSEYASDYTASASYNEVRIWNRALSAADLQLLHNAGPDAALVGSLPSVTAVNLSGASAKLDNLSGQTQTIGSLAGEAGSEVKLSTGALATGGNNSSTTFSGILSGTNGLTKSGAGTFTLAGDNTYTGPTTVNAGTLLINGNNSAASGAVTVASGATLGGAGVVGGATTIQSGGQLSPGANGFGVLTFNNTLLLQPGSTSYFEISHSPLTNDAVVLPGAFNAGGTLTVANAGGASFMDGDSFPLFSAGSYGGKFASVVLPPLNMGLVWNTNLLEQTGTLTVAAKSSPTIAQVSVAGGSVILSGVGGIPAWNYYVLAATNLAMPNWTPIATNQFDLDGNFSFTNGADPNAPQTYFKLQLQ